MYSKIAAITVSLTCLMAPLSAVQSGTSPVSLAAQTKSLVMPKPLSPRLRTFLQAENRDLEKMNSDPGWPVRVSAVSVPASGKNKAIVLVYMTGRSACGTSGCYLFVLERERSSFREIGFIQGWPPFRILPTSSHGRADIGLWVQGGGIIPGYPARSRFDGTTYANGKGDSPDLEKMDREDSGRIVISDTTPDQLLFQ